MSPADLGVLSIFVAVAETSSFSAAAKRLGVTKGTVSRGITRLEQSLGVELLHRTTRRVALSTTGAALYERTALKLAELQQSIDGLPEGSGRLAGELRLAAPVDFGTTLLPQVIARFTERHPEIRVDVTLTYRPVDLVREGLDLAIRTSLARLEDPALMMRRLGRADGHAYASPAYLARRGAPRTPGDPAHDWLLFRDLHPRQLGLPENPRPRVVFDDYLFAREALRAGAGVGILPAFLGEPYVESGQLARVLPELTVRGGGFVLLYPSSGRVPRKVTVFRDLLVDALKECAAVVPAAGADEHTHAAA